MSITATGLSRLDAVTLNESYQQLLETASRLCSGPVAWQQRKKNEARELLALAQCSRRFVVLELDLLCELRAVLVMKATVPCLSHPGARLQLMRSAVLGLNYPQEAMFLPQAGTGSFCILAPQQVWHPNVNYEHPQVCCLGTQAAGIRVRELVITVFGLLCFQNLDQELDPNNPQGVLNVPAAHYWQENVNRLPLSKEAFFVQTP